MDHLGSLVHRLPEDRLQSFSEVQQQHAFFFFDTALGQACMLSCHAFPSHPYLGPISVPPNDALDWRASPKATPSLEGQERKARLLRFVSNGKLPQENAGLGIKVQNDQALTCYRSLFETLSILFIKWNTHIAQG